jgi:hypothetical protein
MATGRNNPKFTAEDLRVAKRRTLGRAHLEQAVASLAAALKAFDVLEDGGPALGQALLSAQGSLGRAMETVERAEVDDA